MLEFDKIGEKEMVRKIKIIAPTGSVQAGEGGEGGGGGGGGDGGGMVVLDYVDRPNDDRCGKSGEKVVGVEGEGGGDDCSGGGGGAVYTNPGSTSDNSLRSLCHSWSYVCT
ncbi:hypothetical protein M0802_012339 [Mischocyttarus mexicanus]|nr:hypothetical protein M0802_012339 [Mischocyttarus mexicanus]